MKNLPQTFHKTFRKTFRENVPENLLQNGGLTTFGPEPFGNLPESLRKLSVWSNWPRKPQNTTFRKTFRKTFHKNNESKKLKIHPH